MLREHARAEDLIVAYDPTFTTMANRIGRPEVEVSPVSGGSAGEADSYYETFSAGLRELAKIQSKGGKAGGSDGTPLQFGALSVAVLGLSDAESDDELDAEPDAALVQQEEKTESYKPDDARFDILQAVKGADAPPADVEEPASVLDLVQSTPIALGAMDECTEEEESTYTALTTGGEDAATTNIDSVAGFGCPIGGEDGYEVLASGENVDAPSVDQVSDSILDLVVVAKS